MANRVVFGQRGTDYGLWVSKPGLNVLTTADENLLFSTHMKSNQIIATGQLVVTKPPAPDPPNEYDIVTPDIGQPPLLLLYVFPGSANGFVNSWELEVISNTLQRVYVPYGGFYGEPTTLAYLILNPVLI